MNASPSRALPEHLSTVLALAHVLQRLDASASVNADQYRSVVQRLAAALQQARAGAALDAVLETHPAAAELYENLHYGHAGLCRAPLEWSLGAEKRAREAIERARKA